MARSWEAAALPCWHQAPTSMSLGFFRSGRSFSEDDSPSFRPLCVAGAPAPPPISVTAGSSKPSPTFPAESGKGLAVARHTQAL